jgi:hypothetical protein
LEESRHTWEDNIKINAKDIGRKVVDWIPVA